MRKYAILVGLMAFVVAVTSSCGLIVKDEAVDAQTVIIEVAGQSIVKSEVQQAITNVMDYQEYVYSMYGMSYDRTDADAIASAQETAINALIEEAVTEQKITEYGLDQFTEEELATITKTVDETYANIIQSVQSAYFADTELTGDELDTAIDAKILELGYGTREEILTSEKNTVAMDKLRELVVADVAVTDDEVSQEYASGVSSAMTTYASDLTQYAADVNNGEIIYFHPEGYRYVKNLLVKISDEDSAAIASLQTQIADNQETLAAVQTAIEELPADPAEDTEDQVKSREELTGQVDTLTVDIADMTTQLDTLTETAYGDIQATVDEIVTKIQAGEDFDALIAEYGEDSGMTVEPTKSAGYLVCEGLTSYYEVFVNEAMALKSVGDISDPFRSSVGVHIVQYASDLEAGQVKLSAIRGEIGAELLATKQDTVYGDTLNQWIAEANAKTYTDRLSN